MSIVLLLEYPRNSSEFRVPWCTAHLAILNVLVSWFLFQIYTLQSKIFSSVGDLLIDINPYCYILFADFSGLAFSKAWIWGRSLVVIVGSNPAGVWMSVVSVVFRQVEATASGWSLVQRSPTECGVSEWDRETSIMRRPWPSRGVCTMGENIYMYIQFILRISKSKVRMLCTGPLKSRSTLF